MYIYIYIYVHMHILCIHMYICIYIYICIYTHRCIPERQPTAPQLLFPLQQPRDPRVYLPRNWSFHCSGTWQRPWIKRRTANLSKEQSRTMSNDAHVKISRDCRQGCRITNVIWRNGTRQERREWGRIEESALSVGP